MTNGEKFKNAVDRARQFKLFCESQQYGCNDCELTDCAGDGCRFAWLDLEYKEKLKPCPFCGGEAKSRKSNRVYYIFCTNCSMKTFNSTTLDGVIAVWNRRAK